MAKILVIEDDTSICFLLEEELSMEGHLVTTVCDGLSGLRAAQELHPDLVILDLNMPGLSGGEVLTRLKASYPQIPVIIHTACDTLSCRGEQRQDAVVIKSSDLAPLMREIEHFVRH